MAEEIKKIKLGVIGTSEGNGHPYSWSAIFNGFDVDVMQACPYPAIPAYLSKQNYPHDFLTDLGSVTHVYTQNREESEHIAKASRIPNVVDSMEELLENVDAVLLATDDPATRMEMVLPILRAGLFVFIDKPFSITTSDAAEMLSNQKFETQIFTCSSLRYAKELLLTQEERTEIGEIKFVEASVMKSWEKYGVHIVEPIVVNLTARGELQEVNAIKCNDIQQTLIKWDNCSAYLKTTGEYESELEFTYFGTRSKVNKVFTNSFSSFREALKNFISQVHQNSNLIERNETLEIVKILDTGKITG